MIDFLKKIYKLNAVYAVLGIANTALLLFYVGVSPTTDVWFASIAVVSSFAKLFMTGFINEIFLPRLVRSWELSTHYAEHLLSNIFTVFAFISIFAVLIIFISSSALVDLMFSNFPANRRAEIVFMMKSVSPVLILIIMNELLAMALNSKELYAQPERARIFSSSLNFVIILSLYSQINIWALFIATIISHLVNLLFLVYSIVSNGIEIGVQFRQRTWRAVKINTKLSSSGFYVLATQAYSLIFKSYLSSFPYGMITVFHYVETIIVKGRSLLMRPLSIVFLTDFSKSTEYQSGFGTWRKLLRYFLILTVFLITIGLIVRYAGIYVLLYVLDSQEFYQLVWFRSLLAFYILLIPLEIILIALRKKIVSIGFFTKYYFIAGISQLFVSAITLYALNYGLNSLYFIYLIVIFDVIPKIAAGAIILFKSNFNQLRAKSKLQ